MNFSVAAIWVLLGLWLSTIASAHPGGLNAEGCHNDRKRGEYHCHDGAAKAVPRPVVPLNFNPQKNTAQCRSKRYCSQMNSCAEAVYYMYNCGLTRLDSDRDGIPCEKICGNHAAGVRNVEQILRNQGR